MFASSSWGRGSFRLAHGAAAHAFIEALRHGTISATPEIKITEEYQGGVWPEQTGFEPKHALYMHRFWPTKKESEIALGRSGGFAARNSMSGQQHWAVFPARNWWITHQQRLSDVL
jgi:hypothetical protein